VNVHIVNQSVKKLHHRVYAAIKSTVIIHTPKRGMGRNVVKIGIFNHYIIETFFCIPEKYGIAIVMLLS
jgi:predicted nucleic acid-binding Zn finger protein